MIKDTNPDHYKADGANFIEYMNDPKISGFGNWMFANGFNSGVWASSNWISVKDRLPEKQKIMIATLAYQHSSNYVLIYIDGISWPYNRKLITIGRYDYDESRWVVRNAFRGKVTHWMPLPEPPKEADNE